MRLTTYVRRHSVQLASALALAALVAAPTVVAAQTPTFTGGTVTALSANITAVSIAVAPPDQVTAFDTSVYASAAKSLFGLSPTGRDSVVRVMTDGSGVVEFQALPDFSFVWGESATAGALAFAPSGSGYSQGIYYAPGTCGLANSDVGFVSPTGQVSELQTGCNTVYRALVFAKPGTAPVGLYGSPGGSIDRIDPTGQVTQIYAGGVGGLAFDELNVFGTPNGGALYFTNPIQPTPGNYAVAVYRLLQTGNPAQPFEATASQVAVTPTSVNQSLTGRTLKFGRGGAFGTGLYVSAGTLQWDATAASPLVDDIYLMTPAPGGGITTTLVGSGFGSTFDGSFEFSYDGSTMYVSTGIVWKITGGVAPPPTTCGDDDKDRDKDREKADADEAKADREANDAKNAASKSAEAAKSKARTKAQKNAIDADLKAKIAQIDADGAKKKADIEADFAKKHPKGKKKHCGGDDDDDDDDHDHDGKGEKGGVI